MSTSSTEEKQYPNFKLDDTLHLAQTNFLTPHVIETITKALTSYKEVANMHQSQEYIFDYLEQKLPKKLFEGLFNKFITSDEVQNMMLSKKADIFNVNAVPYHGPRCSDGHGSAFVIWRYLRLKGVDLDNINFYSCHHLQETQQIHGFVDKLKDKHVVMCDFSYRPSQLLKIISVCKSFLILDHHKTAQTDLVHIPSNLKVFDMKRSGCGITWDTFFPLEPLPRFLAYIQDRDLYSRKLTETSEFVAYFYDQEFDFVQWEEYMLDNKVDEAIAKGKTILAYQKIVIDRLVNRASYFMQKVPNDGKIQIILYVNCPEFKSDIGNALMEKYPFGDFAVVWDYNAYRDQTAVSLRSIDTKSDVSVIAKKLGGGGHRNASGVTLSGIHGVLPFETVEDYGVCGLLNNGVRSVCKTSSNAGMFNLPFQGQGKSNNKSISYVLFKVKEVNPKWFESEFVNILKSHF